MKDIMGSFSAVTVGAASQQFLGPSPKRHCILLSCPASGNVTIAPVESVVQFAGIVLNQGQPPIHLREDNVGHLLYGPWHAIADAAGRVIGVVETVDVGGL